MNEIFSGQAYEILDAFLISEAKSYPKYIQNWSKETKFSDLEMNDDGKEYVRELKEIIAKEIKGKCSEGFNFANFFSLTNMGMTNLTIGITPNRKFWNWQNGNIEIILCSCGRLNHWGSVNLPVKEKQVCD